ncbi:sugar ABC transporter permease [Erysipelothrix inopinata]|uniref:Sugar ABC transporter permease n=1 Tax=Erysipelothrix inopinata TaxID=225084 RepID=A0A7G9RZJ4_9FIRM|nr:sugar ABC transporter permease [Erysipelothrix inopinata]QNN61019.1 sugar ABC transporter permease [Erysipelothrix inopinata]
MKQFIKTMRKNGIFLLMALPGALWMIFFFYIPVFGNVVAFKDFRFSSQGGFIRSVIESDWVGLKNFEFLFSSENAWIITRNTVLYNLGFIFIGTACAVALAVIMSMLRNKRRVKTYQTAMMFPYFLSWIIISFFVYSFLSPDKGVVNRLMVNMGKSPVNWYTDPTYWPFIIILIGIWKNLGYQSVIYFASIMGIDPTYYEAAKIDGANRWQQIRHVTIPQIIPLISIMTILAVGNIMRADFGLFYNVPRNSGSLTAVTQVIDTFVYKGLAASGDLGMSSAAGLYQSVVGFIILMLANTVVRKLDPESSLF